MTKRWSTDEDMLIALKKEIIRLGIQDNPSRTKYQENYDNTIAPSPNAATKRLNASWAEIMNEIGLEYSGSRNIGKRNKGQSGGNRKNSGRKGYSALSTDELFNMVALEIKRNSYKTVSEYSKNHRQGTPSVSVLYQRIGTFKSSELLKSISKYLGYEITMK